LNSIAGSVQTHGVAQATHLRQQPPAAALRGQRAFLHQRPDPLHGLADLEQPLDAGEVDARVLDQMLDAAQPVELFPRVEPHAANGPRRAHQTHALVLAQRLRMHSESLGSHADEKEFVVHEARLVPAAKLIRLVAPLDTQEVYYLIRIVSTRRST
jgi:hypothetical protein